MASDDLQARGRSMEEAFFAGENERLRLAIRAAGEQSADGLGAELGIADDRHVLQGVARHGVDGDVAAAMVLVPLVAVAWADRDLHEAERAAVMRAAEAAGIVEGSPSGQLLAAWLRERPDPELFERWKSFIVALCADMDVHAVEKLRADLIGRARSVAEASGGILGFGKVSGGESHILDELEHAFPA